MIDDNGDDQAFVRYALEKSGAGRKVYAVHDPMEAIGYLCGKGEYADRDRFPVPNVVLCDLKMPGMDGFDFLRWLKRHPDCSVIPTIIFSNSGLPSDVREAYRLGANAYIRKPSSLAQMLG